MTPENKQPCESIDDEFDRFEEHQIEEHEIEMAENRGITERIFELAEKSMDKTLQKNPEKCIRIIEIIEKYNCNRTQWNSSRIECLFYKLNEIYETLHDFYFLLVSAKYNSARILLRKWIELIIVSIYLDTKGKNDPQRKKFLEAQQMPRSLFGNSINELKQCSSDAVKINKFYHELSHYTHNEGKKFGQFFPFYYEKEFNDIYLKLNEIQSLVEKMIAEIIYINI